MREDLLAMFEPTTIEEVEKKYSSIEWQKYIQAIINSDVTISKHENIGIIFHDFMNDLNKLIFETPNRFDDSKNMSRN